jgi:hypothetical protein
MFHDESLKHMLIDHHRGRIIKISRFKIQDSLFKNSGTHVRNKSK